MPGDRHGLPRNARLLKRADFERVFSSSRRSADEFFTVLCRANSLTTARLGLAIPKRRIRLSSSRNRLKRQIRESFRYRREHMQGLDVVVLAREPAARACSARLRASLDRHWSNIRRRCKQL